MYIYIYLYNNNDNNNNNNNNNNNKKKLFKLKITKHAPTNFLLRIGLKEATSYVR